MDMDETRCASNLSDCDEFYEERASQEELYLEKVEENLRAILISEGNAVHRTVVTIEEQRTRAAELLIAGDSDDPPLSEETVVEMLGRSSSEINDIWYA